jgi:hypothetical protein
MESRLWEGEIWKEVRKEFLKKTNFKYEKVLEESKENINKMVIELKRV